MTRPALSGIGLFVVTVWGASFVATRVAVDWLHPVALVAGRLLVGTLVLGALAGLRGGPLLPRRRDWPVCSFLGIVLCGHLLLQARGLLDTTAIHAGWIIAFIPVMIALGAQLLGQQRLRAVGWAGVLLGSGGVLLVTLAQPGGFPRARVGDLLQLASCVTWTVYTLASTRPLAHSGPLPVTVFGMAIAAVLSLAASLGSQVERGPATGPAIVAAVFLGLVCSGVAYYAWFTAQRAHGPTRLGAYLYLEPFVTLGMARVLLRETVTFHALLGGLCVVCGVLLVARGTQRPTALAPAG